MREKVIVGSGVVMGNSCEFKNCILFDEVQVPHFRTSDEADAFALAMYGFALMDAVEYVKCCGQLTEIQKKALTKSECAYEGNKGKL